MALKTPGSTADHYHIPSSQGSIGIIAAFSRTFCGTCNRLRLTPEGHLHHCLYSDQSYPLIEKIRSNLSDESITQEVAQFEGPTYVDLLENIDKQFWGVDNGKG